jgi:hypothetical protein
MKCPHCQRDTFVKDSRPQADGSVRRRRVCRKGHVTTTWETALNPRTHLNFQARNKRHVKKWWESMTPEERAERQKFYRIRHMARKEAKATGQPLEALYERWGVSSPPTPRMEWKAAA